MSSAGITPVLSWPRSNFETIANRSSGRLGSASRSPANRNTTTVPCPSGLTVIGCQRFPFLRVLPRAVEDGSARRQSLRRRDALQVSPQEPVAKVKSRRERVSDWPPVPDLFDVIT